MMCDMDKEDSLTELNTQLNKSMVLMESAVEVVPPLSRSNKSITINTTPQPRTSPNSSSSGKRKSILKKSEKTNSEEISHLDSEESNSNDENTNNVVQETIPKDPALRPRTLEELMQGENLVVETTKSTFNLDDISDDEEIWIMDLPRTVDPHALKGQTLTLGDKSKIKIGHEKYYTVNHDVKRNITCVFNSRKMKSQYKTVNVNPIGSLSLRRKLSNMPKVKPIPTENASVPFPENLKLRHPLFGVIEENNMRIDMKTEDNSVVRRKR